VPLGGAIAAVGSVAAGAIGANAQAKAAKQAANAQVKAADQATALQREIYYDQRDLLTPTITSGADARAHQMLMLGYTPEEVRNYLNGVYGAVSGPIPTPGSSGGQQGGVGTTGPATTSATPPDTSWIDSYDPQSFLRSTPGYQFNFDEGQRALERSKAAGGDYFSGDTARAIARYGEDYGSNYWNHLFDQYGSLAGEGQTATGTTVNVAGQYGDSAAANTRAAGRARASGYEQAGNAWGNFWQGAAGVPMYAYGQGWLGK